MKKEYTNILGILTRLDLLYADHLASLDNEAVPDLNTQTKVRDMEIKRLTAGMANFMEVAEAAALQEGTESMLKCINGRIADILEQNKALELKVTAYKKELQKNMARVSRGRNAIGAYRSPGAPGAVNRVLSIAN